MRLAHRGLPWTTATPPAAAATKSGTNDEVIDRIAGIARARAQGTLVMPHLGSWERWADSNVFADYTAGRGGSDGECNRVNISEVRLLAR